MNMIACNVSGTLDLHGPALVTDAACSSALLAVHGAVLHLRTGICDAAIVGGVYTICTPDLLIGFSRIGALSGNDVCRPFDPKGGWLCPGRRRRRGCAQASGGRLARQGSYLGARARRRPQ